MITDSRHPKNISKEQLTDKMKTFTTFINLLTNYETNPKLYEPLLRSDAVFFEYPNLVTKNVQTRDLSTSFKGIEISKTILSAQHYTFIYWFETEDKLTVEVVWKGTMAIDAGHLKKGQELKAYICMIVEFNDNKIFRQRNYDCYEPFD